MNKTGTLKHGLKVGETKHTEFEIEPANSGHIFDAEDVADTSTPIKFAAALLCQQLVRIGSFTGPFTLEILRKMKPSDLELMQGARLALASEGEDEQLG